MATTIQISLSTKQLLESLKQHEHVATYDQVILQLLRDRVGVPKSLYGAVKGMTWGKDDRLNFHEL